MDPGEGLFEPYENPNTKEEKKSRSVTTRKAPDQSCQIHDPLGSSLQNVIIAESSRLVASLQWQSGTEARRSCMRIKSPA
jgi:hypothetical protein